jgi:hypothetical protein
MCGVFCAAMAHWVTPVSNRCPLIKMIEHRFPPPWTVEETPSCFIVRDANGQALNYTYYFTEEMSLGGEQYDPLTMLTKDDARWIALNVAKLAELLQEPPK